MSWAARRRFIILSMIGAVAVAFLVIFGIATFSKAPSCSDRSQNQGEAGVDCGGPCAFLCVDQAYAPTILFAKALPNGAGRTDVIASVENVNPGAAAKDVPYTITLYGAGQVFVQEVKGKIDLLPSSSVPVFIPGITSGSQKTVRAFLTIDEPPRWYALTDTAHVRPVVVNTTLSGASTTPRIDASLSNGSVMPMENVRVIVIVHGDTGEVIAASQTIVPAIPAQGQATATFTWNSAFSGIPAKIEVLPVVALP